MLSNKQSIISVNSNAGDTEIPLNDDDRKFSPIFSSCRKFLLIIVLGVQGAISITLTRYTRTTAIDESELFDVFNFVFLTEAAKLLMACMAEFYCTNGDLMKSFQEHIFETPMDALKLVFPASLYFVQNSCTYFALRYINAPLFLITLQSRIVTTALLNIMMLGRSYLWKQWILVVVLILGISVALVGAKDSVTNVQNSLLVGLALTLTACMACSTASIFFDIVIKDNNLKEEQKPSVWMRNIQMSLFSTIIAGAVTFDTVEDDMEQIPFFHAFSPSVWVLLVIQAGGGLFISYLLQEIDSTTKGLVPSVSILLSAMGSSMFLGFVPTTYFIMGALYVSISVFYFGNPLPSCLKLDPDPTTEVDEVGIDRRSPAVELSNILIRRQLSGEYSTSDFSTKFDRPRFGKRLSIDFMRGAFNTAIDGPPRRQKRDNAEASPQNIAGSGTPARSSRPRNKRGSMGFLRHVSNLNLGFHASMPTNMNASIFGRHSANDPGSLDVSEIGRRSPISDSLGRRSPTSDRSNMIEDSFQFSFSGEV